MSLQPGDVSPNFEADTTEGRIGFHEWIGDSDDEARQKFPQGWRALKPYLRLVPQPKD